MRKTSTVYYNEGDIHQIVKDELERAKFAWLDEFTKVVAKFKDKVMTVLDKVMGELKTIREEQTLHQGQHDTITKTFEGLDKRIHKLEQPAL